MTARVGNLLATVATIPLLLALMLASSSARADERPACASEAAIADAKTEFLRLRDLRKRNPDGVPPAEFQRAATHYVSLAEQCYEQKYAASASATSDATNPIDAGGKWFGGTPDGVSEFFTFGTKWGSGSPFAGGPDVPGPGISGGEVTYSLMPDGVDNSLEESTPNVAIGSLASFAPCFPTEIDDAFDAWSAVADIHFSKVADDGLPFNLGSAADIRIGAHSFDGAGGTLAHGYYPPPNGLTAAGDVHFDSDELWVCDDTGPGFDIGIVALHEIGHAIGMEHQDPAPIAIMNPFYNAANSVLLPDDIAGAESIYGAGSVICQVDTTQAAYTGSQTVAISKLSIANASTPTPVEWKAWLEIPTLGAVGLINLGSDSSVVLPSGFSAEIAPIDLFPANLIPPGTYTFGCRVLDPVTGAPLAEDQRVFQVGP